jgi:uncharacterized SAM-binding protein YcdF (DUF218 family)
MEHEGAVALFEHRATLAAELLGMVGGEPMPRRWSAPPSASSPPFRSRTPSGTEAGLRPPCESAAPAVFLFLSKLLDLAFTPLAWSLALGVLGLLLVRRRPRLSRSLTLAGLAILYVFSIHPVAGALTRAVERDVQATARADVVYDAVIVLGGMAEAGPTELTGQPQFAQAVERMLVGWEQVASGRARVLIISGGAIDADPRTPREADTVARQLISLGLTPDQVLREDRSRNTRENALFTAELVRARGFEKLLLVTSAFHMPRSLGCFRAVGLEPDVLPTDFRSPGPRSGLRGWLPRAEALEDSSDMLRELAGRLVYRARGWTR